MTEEEYLEYDRTHDGKREFVNGELIDMAGASEAHGLVVGNLFFAIKTRLRGGACRAFVADMRVRIDETGLYAYPDIVVVCGKAEFAPTRPESLLNPSMVVEVLSPTTAGYDRGAKLEHYRRRPSIRAILLVDSVERRMTRYIRNADDTWTLADHLDGTVPIGPLELELSMDEIFEGTEEAMARAAADADAPAMRAPLRP
ncbi:MAG: Uma2 family endonuclease [Myxococcota bacterium]